MKKLHLTMLIKGITVFSCKTKILDRYGKPFITQTCLKVMSPARSISNSQQIINKLMMLRTYLTKDNIWLLRSTIARTVTELPQLFSITKGLIRPYPI